MRRLELSVLLALIFCAAVSMLTVDRECGRIREDVLRLHVIANSDSAEDQRIKYLVRDGVLECCSPLFSGQTSADEAAEKARENIELIENAAREILIEQGSDMEVHVEVGESYFDTRTYGDKTLPAGRYRAVRVVLGEGRGTNWWCVMFPPMCISASSDSADFGDVLDERELELMENGYDVRLWCVEWLCRLRENGQ